MKIIILALILIASTLGALIVPPLFSPLPSSSHHMIGGRKIVIAP
jgi:hypothetical protein